MTWGETATAQVYMKEETSIKSNCFALTSIELLCLSSRKPRALDLFCSQGGITKGLQNAGFHVTGVDIEPQPRYCGDEFFQADALDFDVSGYDVIFASPPCQAYSVTKTLTTKEHPKLIEKVRKKLKASGKIYVIENVPGAPLENPLMLCGTMFGLNVIRHRLFETNAPIFKLLPPCNHHKKTAKRGEFDTAQNGFVTVAGHNFQVDVARRAMGISWMTAKGLAQAIPPVYSEFLGRLIIKELIV
jgi:DNA (cytosine-5)-methyltransferase 1